MAVVPMWKCDRDGAMFDNKKDAEAHDKILELAAGFSLLLERHIKSLGEDESERLGMLLAENREKVVIACKGKPEVLDDL